MREDKRIYAKLYSAKTGIDYPDKHLVWAGTIKLPRRMIGYPDVVMFENSAFTFRRADHSGVTYVRARLVNAG